MAIQSRWPADYFDGRSARKQPITVVVTERGLRLVRADGSTTLWPYDEVRQTQGNYVGEQIRFERGDPLPEALVIPDRGVLEAIEALAPRQERRLRPPVGGWRMVRASALALAGLVVGGWGLYNYGVPALAGVVAARVPVAWEVDMGRRARDELVPANERCADAARERAVTRIVDRLVAAGPPSAYTYHVVISRSDDFNAFATPGGFIVVNQGLLEKTKSPEQLAGVLAHEIEHVEHRHATRAMCEELSTRALLSLVLHNGDGFGNAVNAIHALGMLGRSRQAEAEADADGMRRVIAAGIDPKGMLETFELMKGEGPEVPAVLSDHPDTSARLERLKAIAATAKSRPQPLDVGMPWTQVAKGCT